MREKKTSAEKRVSYKRLRPVSSTHSVPDRTCYKFQTGSNKFGPFAHTAQAPVPRGVFLIENITIDTSSIIANPQSQTLLVETSGGSALSQYRFRASSPAQDSPHQDSIHGMRLASNTAIASGDVMGFAVSPGQDFVVVTGNGSLLSREAYIAAFAKDFEDPHSVRFERIPDSTKFRIQFRWLWNTATG